ncbi:MAG: hypothetical protein HY737_05725 [Candidatus Omnitrophica bacterium]|nr:hypothetical protein [Candidatus Omnitrophota bacterium]
MMGRAGGWRAVALIGGLCVAGGPVWADTTDDKIAQLEAQVRALQGQLDQLKQQRESDRKELASVKEAAHGPLGSLDLGQNTGVMVTGAVDLAYQANESASRTFENGHFNPIFLGMLGENVLMQAELEYENGGDEKMLEYATIDWMVNDYLTLEGGKFLMPFGEWNDRLHPTWINKFPTRPIIFDEVLPGEWTEIGAQARGAVGINKFLGTDRPVDVEYTAYLTNGLEGASGASLRDLRDNVTDSNDNIAVGTRWGLRVLPWGSIGTSWYRGAYTTDGTLDLNMWGLDWAAHPTESLEIRGEYILTFQEVATPNTDQEDLLKKGWYLQAAYSLNDLAVWLGDLPGSRYLGNTELVGRFSQAALETTSGTDNQHEFGIGVNYYLRPSLVWRLAYEWSQENAGTAKVDDDLFITQIAYGF